LNDEKKKNEEKMKEKEHNQMKELRMLHIKNLSILFSRSCLKEGKKLATQRFG
jgi:hypothetical protein